MALTFFKKVDPHTNILSISLELNSFQKIEYVNFEFLLGVSVTFRILLKQSLLLFVSETPSQNRIFYDFDPFSVHQIVPGQLIQQSREFILMVLKELDISDDLK